MIMSLVMKILKKYLKIITFGLLFVSILIIGVAGFILIERLSFLESLHLTISTITTVGYGDIVPETTTGKIFADFIMVFGIGIGFYCLMEIFGYVLTGRLKEVFKLVDYVEIIEKMDKHVIVCGYGRVGRATVKELLSKKVDVVVLDNSEENLKGLPKNVPRILGNATKEEDLRRAGLGKAKCVIITFGRDSDIVLAVITVKYFKPSLITIVRSNSEENIEKMYKVGADNVISPEIEGGKSMAYDAIKIIHPSA